MTVIVILLAALLLWAALDDGDPGGNEPWRR